MTDTATLITQLRVLAQLTRTEAQVARLRVAQANTDDVRDELRENAADADARATRIAGALHDLGALPDPVTPLFGRVAALVKGAVEQAQPLDEALLGDLALEHQLRDRARYVGALAAAAGLAAVHDLAADLEAAHTETVDWLTGVLADLAAGQAAIDASPLQKVAAQVSRAANAPTRPVLDEAAATVTQTVGRAVGTVAEVGKDAKDVAGQYAGRAAQAGLDAAGTAVVAGQEAFTTGRDLAARTADQVVRHLPGTGTPEAEDGDSDTAPTEAAPTDAGPTEITPSGPVSDDEPAGTGDAPPAQPIAGFAELPAHVAVAALRALDDIATLTATLAFEQAHGNRPGVVAAARLRATSLRAD